MKEGQSGLDEGAGSLVHTVFVIVECVVAVKLWFWQYQVHQANELLWTEPENKLLGFLLKRPKGEHQSHQHQQERNKKKKVVTMKAFDPTWGIFWSRPCQIRGMWLHAHKKSRAEDGSSLIKAAKWNFEFSTYRIILNKTSRLWQTKVVIKLHTCSLCACWEEHWYTAAEWTSLTDV